MTTTGVAMHQQLIAALAPSCVVIEEAAEVLEAHVLTSLSADTEHLILIGAAPCAAAAPACFAA